MTLKDRKQNCYKAKIRDVALEFIPKTNVRKYLRQAAP